MRAKDIAQCALMVAVILFLVWLLTGCFGLTSETRGKDTTIVLDADCDENTVRIDLNEDIDEDNKEAEVTK